MRIVGVKRFLIATACLIFACLAGGCVTAPFWDAANQTTLPYQSVVGTVPLRQDAGVTRALVVEYKYLDESSAVFIPLNADGGPVAPFAFPVEQWKESDDFTPIVSESQRSAIFQAAEAHAGATPTEAAELIFDPTWYFHETETWSERRREHDGLEAIIFGVDEKGRIVALRSYTDRPKLADGGNVKTFVALVPQSRPRSQAARDRSRHDALIVTPLSIAVDCVLVPPVIALTVVTLLLGGLH